MKYDEATKVKLLNYFLDYITSERKKRFEEIIAFRTKHIAVVLEDIYQPHNASAVLRSCDLTGVQDIHIIENKNQYNVNPQVDMGSSKWLNLHYYSDSDNNTLAAYKKLKDNGYTIVATTPHKDAQDLNSLNIDNKTAIVFGTELTGLSDIAINNADEFLKIPMYGFTESYNISVSAALTLYTLTERLRKSDISWQLSESNYIDILLNWSRNSINRWEVLEKHFFNTQ